MAKLTLEEVGVKYATDYELKEVLIGEEVGSWIFLCGNEDSGLVVQHHSNGYSTAGYHDEGFNDFVITCEDNKLHAQIRGDGVRAKHLS